MAKTPKSTTKPAYPAPFSLRLTDQERLALREMAGEQPIGQFIKDTLFDKSIRPPKRYRHAPADQKLIAKLLAALGSSRIASNINQLAKAANSGSLPVNMEVIDSLNEAVEAIRWMRSTLIEAMGIKPQSHDKEDDRDFEG